MNAIKPIALAILLVLLRHSHSETLTWLGQVSPGQSTGASKVSGDGLTVIGGQDLGPAFRWTAAGGMQPLLPVGDDNRAAAHAIAGDGSVVAGDSHSDRFRAAYWDAVGEGTYLGIEHEGMPHSLVTAMSADGLLLGGVFESWNNGPFDVPFLYSLSGGLRLLPTEAEQYGVYVQGISADGRRIVARGDNSAYIWDSETSYRKLEGFVATDLSGDGRFVFGSDANNRAVRWSDDRGLEDLGTLPGYFMTVRGASFSGSTLLATAYGGMSGGVHTALWRQDSGWVLLDEYLRDRGVDLGGGQLNYSAGVSWDGNVVTGTGRKDGQRQPFVATVPEPSSAVLIGLGLSALALLRRKR